MKIGTKVIILAVIILAVAPGLVSAAGEKTSLILDDLSYLLASTLGWLLPLGILLLGAGASPEAEAKQVMTIGLTAIPVAILAYSLLGFGFQFGGLGLVSALAGAESLRREWSPLDLAWGPGWGTIGLDGFYILGGGLSDNLATLFFHQAPLLAAATAIPFSSLWRRLKFSWTFILALLWGGFFYPIFGNWIWGGGWLSQLGKTVALGHGAIDFGGGGTVFTMGAIVALAGILVLGGRLPAPRGIITPPPVHLPILATVGTFLVLVGTVTLALGNPLLEGGTFLTSAAVHILLAAVAGLFMAAAYTWFATGKPELLMMVRGGVGGLVAGLAIGPFTPPWAALLAGVIAGLVLPSIVYLVEVRLRWEDPAASLATYLFPGILGLVFLGLFADGRSGAGWNGVGIDQYLGVAGQGVSSLLVATGYQPTPGQLYAQFAAIGALLVFFLFSWLLFKALGRLGMEKPAKPPTTVEKPLQRKTRSSD